ncbi:hypothetical protein PJ267_04590 [Arthrobacter sp. OVS8]|nr:hypothetical protein PJ267_04590 [Arthrobacter sp. OVS8]
MLGKLGKVLPVEPDGDGDVLLRRCELIADLAGQQLIELWAHGALLESVFKGWTWGAKVLPGQGSAESGTAGGL